MAPSAMRSDNERIDAFADRFAKAQATSVIDLPWGYALLQTDFPNSYDHNRIVVKSAVSADAIFDAGDEILGGAGLTHRHVSVDDDEVGLAVATEFVAAGYEHTTLVTMINAGDHPIAEPPAHEVRAVSVEDLRRAVTRDWRTDLPTASDDEIAQLAGRARLYSQGADTTLLAAFDGDTIAARVNVFVDSAERIAQIESLYTHQDFRGRGFADAVMAEAQRRVQQANCSLSFLVANHDDWPLRWYQKLGYTSIGHTRDFVLTAQ